MIIPADALEADTLDALIRDFVLREGTDHGHEDEGFDEKVAQVYTWLNKGEAYISYSEVHESVSIRLKSQDNL